MNPYMRNYAMNIALALVACVFLAQLAFNVRYGGTWMDEGNYSYKGFAIVSGQYDLYADYGPWFDYYPLSFLIPGYVQYWAGPDFLAIRLFSAACAALIFLVLYRLSYRQAGTPGVFVSLLLLVGSPVTMRYYSTGTPYAWVGLFLILSLYTLQSRMPAPFRQVLTVFFATLTLMVRQTMIPAWLTLVCSSDLFWNAVWRENIAW